MITKKSIEIHVTHHCNLNCKGCCHYAPLAEPYYLQPEQFEKDLSKIKQSVLNQFQNIMLLGGEPLLNKDLYRIVAIARKYFIHANISILTNGILLNKIDDKLIDACIQNNIEIRITKYPISLDYDQIVNLLQDKGLQVTIFGERYDDQWMHSKFDLKGLSNQMFEFQNCLAYKTYDSMQLRGTKLYMCSMCAYIDIFNKFFNTDLKITRHDYLDLTKARPVDIILWPNTPKPFCKYCKVKEMIFEKWQTSNKAIEEWT